MYIKKSSKRRISDKSDWKRVMAVKDTDHIPYDPEDGPYDPNDAKAAEKFFATAIVRRPGQRGPQKAPTKRLVSLRLSQDVLAHYKASGAGWQTRIDEDLRRCAGK